MCLSFSQFVCGRFLFGFHFKYLKKKEFHCGRVTVIMVSIAVLSISDVLSFCCETVLWNSLYLDEMFALFYLYLIFNIGL